MKFHTDRRVRVTRRCRNRLSGEHAFGRVGGLLILTLLVLLLIEPLDARSAQSPDTIYDPAGTAALLMNQPFANEELPAAKTPVEAEAKRADILHRITIEGANGSIAYDIYPSAEAAGLYDISPWVEPIPVEGQPSRTMTIKETADGAAACLIERNIQICGSSNGQLSMKPATDAIKNTEGGLAHLLRVAKPTAAPPPVFQPTPFVPREATPRQPVSDERPATPTSTESRATPSPLPASDSESPPEEANSTIGVGSDLGALLPTEITVPDGPPFVLEQEAPLSFDEATQRLEALSDPDALLRGWGWTGGYNRSFTRVGAPSGNIDWLQLGLQEFARPEDAQTALASFADARAAGTPLKTGPGPALGDRSLILSGPSDTGTEVSVYVSSGNLLLRVTGVAPTGDPSAEVVALAEQIVPLITP